MIFAAAVLAAWLVVSVVTIVHKPLSFADLVFLYIITFIFTTCTFTFLDLNLKAVTASRTIEKAFANIVSRTVTIPLLLVLSVIALRSSWKLLSKWGTVLCILFVLNALDWFRQWTGVITYRNWNHYYTLFLYVGFMIFVNLVGRWFIRLDGERGRIR